MAKVDIFNVLFREKPANMLVEMRRNSKKEIYASNLAKTVDCTYSHVVKILQQMQKAGLVGFEWKDLPEEIKSSNSPITIRAFTGNVGDTGELSTQVFASVSGTSKTDTGVMLEVEDYGTIDPSQVVRFKN